MSWKAIAEALKINSSAKVIKLDNNDIGVAGAEAEAPRRIMQKALVHLSSQTFYARSWQML